MTGVWLTPEECARFVSYLRQEAASDMQLVEQLKKLEGTGSLAMARKLIVESSAITITADRLESWEEE